MLIINVIVCISPAVGITPVRGRGDQSPLRLDVLTSISATARLIIAVVKFIAAMMKSTAVHLLSLSGALLAPADYIIPPRGIFVNIFFKN